MIIKIKLTFRSKVNLIFTINVTVDLDTYKMYVMTPIDQISTSLPYGCWANTSGAEKQTCTHSLLIPMVTCDLAFLYIKFPFLSIQKYHMVSSFSILCRAASSAA